MPDLTWADWESVSNDTSSPLGQVTNAAKQVFCRAYSYSPGGMLAAQGVDLPYPPAIKQGVQVANQICFDRKSPQASLPASRPQFPGGQCSYIYRVDATFKTGDTSTPTKLISQSVRFWVKGAISNFSVEGDTFTAEGRTAGKLCYVTAYGSSTDGASVGTSSNPVKQVVINTTRGVFDLSIDALTPVSSFDTPMASTPDNCGNPSPPALPAPPLTSTDLTRDVYFPPTQGNPGGVVTVRIAPTINLPVQVDVNNNINASIHFNVEVDGINLDFSTHGVNITPSANFDSPVTLPKLPPTAQPTTDTRSRKDAPLGNVDLSEVLTKLDDIIACACDATGTVDATDYAEAESRVLTLPDGAFAVLLHLSKINQGAKSESGLSAPDVHYAGWTSFGFSGSQGARTPIDFLYKWYNIPDRAQTFAYTCRVGYAATVRVLHHVVS